MAVLDVKALLETNKTALKIAALKTNIWLF